MNYSPVYGSLLSSYVTSSNIILCDYNRKSKEGSLIAIVTEDLKISLINTENLTIIRSFLFNNNLKLRIKDNSKVTALNFKLADTLLVGYSDGSIIKSKLNDDPFNLLYENTVNKFKISADDEFEKIKSVFSTDTTDNRQSDKIVDNYDEGFLIEYLLVSKKYKIIFSFQKSTGSFNKVNILDLRNNTFERTFCKIEGMINSVKLLDKRDLLLVVVFNIETKQSNLDIWHYSDGSCPISTFKISNLLEYPYTIKTMNLASMPMRYIGRNSNHGMVDGDLIFLGTTKGDVILGKIYNLHSNNKAGFELLFIYKLKNNIIGGEELSNKFEISFLSFDLFFDILVLGDSSSNVRFFEKVMQIGKPSTNEENFPFFSFLFESYKPPTGAKNKYKNEINYDLPLFSVNHDVIKDRSIIMYDNGRDLIITPMEEENQDESVNKEKNVLLQASFGDSLEKENKMK